MLPGKYVAIEKLCIYYLQAVGSLILGTTRQNFKWSNEKLLKDFQTLHFVTKPFLHSLQLLLAVLHRWSPAKLQI